MDHKLSVVVQVDLECRYVHLVVTGCLTERNHGDLSPLIRRARALVPEVPGVTVNVDLTAAHHVEPGALELLQWSVDRDHAADGPVRVLTRPDPFWSPADAALLPPLPPGDRSWARTDGVAA